MKEVAKKDSTAVALADLLSDEAGFGTEFQKEELAIPFVKILQAMSNEVKKSEGEYVEGAEEGDLYHTVTNKAYKKLLFVPCRFQHLLNQWRTREAGGGFVAAFEAGDPAAPKTVKDEFRDVVVDNPETYIDNTLQYIGLVMDDDGNNLGPAVVSFKSTGLKIARRFNAAISAKKLRKSDGSEFRAPIFSHMYELTTKSERNAKGSWFSYEVGGGEFIKNPQLLTDAMDFAKSLAEERKVFVEAEESEPVEKDDSFEI